MSATLPTTFSANHAPTSAEMAQILNAITRITNWGVSYNVGGASLTTSSTTYVDVPGTSVSWTKTADSASSDVFCFVVQSCYVDTVNVQPQIGVHIGVSDYDVALMTFNFTSTHQMLTGFRTITGIGAGVYSPNLRCRRGATTAGTIHIDSGDTAALLLIEMPK